MMPAMSVHSYASAVGSGSAPQRDVLALERTSTGSTHSKGSSFVDFCQKFIFGPFCEFLNFSFIFF
jgi:hypothetical protein